jgi:chromosome segregation ATPase
MRKASITKQKYVRQNIKGETIRRKVEQTMADIIDLAAKINERNRRLDQVDQALAEMRRAAAAAGTRGRRDRAKKQKRGPRQLRLPLPLSNDGYR